MPNDKKKFRVMSDTEFWKLTRVERMAYLNAALEYSDIHKAQQSKPPKPKKRDPKN